MDPSLERDRIVAALRAESVRVIAASNDPQADRDAARLLDLLEFSSQDQHALTALAWRHWLRVCTMSQGAEGDRDTDFAIMARVMLPCLLLAEDISEMPAAALSVLAERITDPIAARRELGAPVNESDPNEVAALHMRMLEVTPPASPNFLPRLTAVRDALKQDFARARDPKVLDRLVLVTSGAVDALPPGLPGRAAVLAMAVGAVTQRFEEGTAQDGDLDAAVAWSREALDATAEGSMQHHRARYALASALNYRAGHTGAVSDATEAVGLAREIESTVEFEPPQRLGPLLVLALAKLVTAGEADALEPLLDELEKLSADDRVPDGLGLVRATVAQLATDLTGSDDFDVERFAAFARRALALPGLDDETTQALRMALEAVKIYGMVSRPMTSMPEPGALQEIGDAIKQFTELVEQDPDLAEMVGDLHAQIGKLDALLAIAEETDPQAQMALLAVQYRSDLAAAADDRDARVSALTDLGELLLHRYAHDETRCADLDEAVALLGEAMALSSTREAAATAASHLVMALWVRYRRTGDPADLDQASALGREFTVDGALDEQSVGERLAALADADLPSPKVILQPSAFGSRSAQQLPEYTAILEMLQFGLNFSEVPESEAIAERLVPNQAMRAVLSALADPAAHMRGDATGLDELLAMLDEKASMFPEGEHAHRMIALSRLAAEGFKATSTENPEEIARFIELGEARLAADDLPANVKPSLALVLAHAHTVLLQISERDGLTEHRERALRPEGLAARLRRQLDTAVDPALAPAYRIRALLAATDLVTAAGRPSLAQPYLALAVALLPLAASRHVRLDRRMEYLRQFSGITADAVALALRVKEDPQSDGQALRLLEGGRSVLQNQIIDSRRELTDLHRAAPELAARFEELTGKLAADDAATATDADREWRHRAAEELKQVTTQVRSVEGFDEFGDPPTPERMREAAGEGPIVALNLSRFGGHALIARPEGIERLHLPEAALPAATGTVNVFVQAVNGLYGPEAEDFELSDRYQRHVLASLTWVHKAITGPVLDHLGLDPREPGDCPRLWWAPGGLLGLLPLHAAGDYDAPEPVLTADRVVSSYTPTIRHLLHARSQAAKTGPSGLRGFAAALERTPGGVHPPLPYARDEVARLQGSAPGVFGDLLLNELADRAAVLEALDRSDIAHFVCHAHNDADKPASSGIVLHDHGTAPLTVGDLSHLRLERRRLAYLSACRTAQATSATLLDESLHLAAACQVAGFPYVVGTLWPVLDRHSPEFAERFYTALGENGGLDLGHCAMAVHKAQAALRSEGLERAPHMWASWLHYGA